MKQLKWLFFLMSLTLIAIIGFQAYWLKDSYAREKQNLDIKAGAAFRQTILNLQASKLKLLRDSTKFKLDSISMMPGNISFYKKKNAVQDTRNVKTNQAITIANLVAQKLKDSAGNNQPQLTTILITLKEEGGTFLKSDSSNVKALKGKLARLGVEAKGHMLKLLPPQIPYIPLEKELLKERQDSTPGKVHEISEIKFRVNKSLPDNDSLTHGLVAETTGKKTRILIRDINGNGTELPLNALKPDRISSVRVMRDRIPAEYHTAPSDSFISVKKSYASARIKKTSSSEATKKIIQESKKKDSAKSEYKIIYNIDAFRDSLKISEIDSAFAGRLHEERIFVPFSVIKLDSVPQAESPSANEVVISFGKPVAYQYSLLNSFSFIISQLTLPIIFSIFLVGITLLSFWLLYRNVLRQQKLAAIKNEFINNITHELKTPIATVSVAIEALKNFNAINNPQRTKEYLNISSNELQRLSMLIDKVLTLTVLGKKQIELKCEMVCLKEVSEEVITSLKPQIEKHCAEVQINQQGNAVFYADRPHILSVIFNLVDNAIKYSKKGVAIHIGLKEKEKEVQLIIADNGIGIPDEYKHKIFETFFRVPHGDTHNAKGHGLGLSYVASVVQQHNGAIEVSGKENEGTIFTITFPKQKI